MVVAGLRQVAHVGTSNRVGTVRTPLYTVGYEGRTIGELLDALVQADVRRLVDVRELPLSRRRGFSKTSLTEALGELGIEYIHIKPLGNPKRNRERYWSGDIEGGAEAFRDHLHNKSYDALVDLAKSLDEEAACLLCYERDHAACHRDVIAESLQELRRDLSVAHL
jgi:uncharacterized protein (DUF488 family)